MKYPQYLLIEFAFLLPMREVANTGGHDALDFVVETAENKSGNDSAFIDSGSTEFLFGTVEFPQKDFVKSVSRGLERSTALETH